MAASQVNPQQRNLSFVFALERRRALQLKGPMSSTSTGVANAQYVNRHRLGRGPLVCTVQLLRSTFPPVSFRPPCFCFYHQL